MDKGKKTVMGKDKVRIKRVGTRRIPVIVMWVLLIGSVVFGIFNNINSTTKVINNETVVTVEKLKDTNGVWVFAHNFIKAYYTWDSSRESVAARMVAVNVYLTPELQELNKDTVREDVPVKSTVTDIQIWGIDDVTEYTDDVVSSVYDVYYSVTQSVSDGKDTVRITSCYSLRVHEDADGSMVIIKNPTVCSIPGTSDYQPEAVISDGSVDADTRDDVLSFLESFFTLYPGATESELSYYVRDSCLKPVGSSVYVFAELVNPVMLMEDDNVIRVKLAVKYLDNATKMSQVSQFDLGIVKDGANWVIIRSE